MFSLSLAHTDCYVLPVGFRAPMTKSCLLKNRFTSILVILLITLHISSCGTGDTNATDSANFDSGTTDINFDPNTDAGTGNSNTFADINLAWVAPAEREDNSPISLSEIAGYQILYGQSQGQYSNSIIISDGTAVGYTLTDLPTGTYYFVVATIDTEGRESQYSPEVTVVI